MITKIITADEAACITSKAIEQDLFVQLEGISLAIAKAAENGKFEIDWHEHLSSRAREYLKNSGYKLQDWRELNEEYVNINWRKN